jgi:hypothetical protein
VAGVFGGGSKMRIASVSVLHDCGEVELVAGAGETSLSRMRSKR